MTCLEDVKESLEKMQRQKRWETRIAWPLESCISLPIDLNFSSSSKPNETTSSLQDLPQESLDVYTVPSAGVERILPKMDFTMDPKDVFLYSVMANKANGDYKEVETDYQDLLTSYNLRELYILTQTPIELILQN